MKNEWKNIDETTRNRLEEALDQREMNFKEYSQEWFEDGQIDEVAFCENFLQRMPLKCINGIFFSYDGMLPDGEVEKEIYRMVKPVLPGQLRPAQDKGIQHLRFVAQGLECGCFKKEIGEPGETERLFRLVNINRVCHSVFCGRLEARFPGRMINDTSRPG